MAKKFTSVELPPEEPAVAPGGGERRKFALASVRTVKTEPVVFSLEDGDPDSTAEDAARPRVAGRWWSSSGMVPGGASVRELVEGSSRRGGPGTDRFIYLRVDSVNFVIPTTFQKDVTYVFQTRRAGFVLPKPGKVGISVADLFECLMFLGGDKMPRVPEGSLPEVAFFRMTE